MAKSIKSRFRGVETFRRLLIQYVIIFILVIVTNTAATIWLEYMNNSIHDAQQKVLTLNILDNIRDIDDSEIQAAEEDLAAKESKYGYYKRIIDYGLIGLTMAFILYLSLISVIGYRQIRRNSQELQASVTEAESANKAKSMFLANVSHEIRTPLNAIIGFAEIMNNELANTKSGAYADVIQKSANLLLSIINDILDISKIESGNITLENRPYDIKEMLHQMSEMYRIRADEKGVHMVFVLDSQMPRMIRGDSLRLQQVITNLLSNAIKFTPEGGTITLTVECLEDYEEQIHVSFSVKDTGIGIPKEAQERIFLPFSQADGGVSRNFGGTGLGLTISRRILEMMASELALESYPRQGSNFHFQIMMDKDIRYTNLSGDVNASYSIALFPQYLALLRVHQRLISMIEQSGEVEVLNSINGDISFNLVCLFARESVMEDYHTLRLFHPHVPVIYIGDKRYLDAADMGRFDEFIEAMDSQKNVTSAIEKVLYSQQHTIVSSPLFNGKVLIADGNDTDRLLLEILLEKAGMFVEVVTTGQQAVEAVKLREYDMIFIDIHMPEKDGIHAAREILNNENEKDKPHVPMIAITPNALKGIRDKYIHVGMDDYISKPFTENHLLGLLRKHLSKKNETEAVPSEIKTDKKVEAAPVAVLQPTALAPYNPDEVAEVAGIDRLTLDMLLENFYLSFDSDFNRLKSAVQKRDLIDIEKTSSYMRGAAINLCFESGGLLLQEVEDHAMANRIDAIDLEPIERYFIRIKNDLNIR